MLLSEFITQLQTILNEHGDRPIRMTTGDFAGCDVTISNDFGVFKDPPEFTGDTSIKYIIGGNEGDDKDDPIAIDGPNNLLNLPSPIPPVSP